MFENEFSSSYFLLNDLFVTLINFHIGKRNATGVNNIRIELKL
jgi:hypothetical protein